jgi:transketolase
VSCPQQLLGIMKWIMEGNRGLVYLRVMRAPSAVLYDSNYVFEFGKGHMLKQSPDDVATIISTSRGVHEALSASAEAAKSGLKIGVVDMPSIDEELLLKLYDSGKLLCFAEQNNGYLLQNFLKVLYRRKKSCDWSRIMSINALDAEGKPQYIHSGTYEELIEAFNLTPSQMVRSISERVGETHSSKQ